MLTFCKFLGKQQLLVLGVGELDVSEGWVGGVIRDKAHGVGDLLPETFLLGVLRKFKMTMMIKPVLSSKSLPSKSLRHSSPIS